jgi:hypothetical protein
MPQGDSMERSEAEFEGRIRMMTKSLMTSGFTANVHSNSDVFATTADRFECLGLLYYVQVNVLKRQKGDGGTMTI